VSNDLAAWVGVTLVALVPLAVVALAFLRGRRR